MVYVFNSLNFDYAVLGTEEWCCGDHILRLGEKGLFEILAEHNIDAFKSVGAKNVLTLSPHCYNTFKHDKPYANMDLNIQHYSEFLVQAIERGKLAPKKTMNRRVTYHDPCFLGKRNGIYEAPRRVLRMIDGLELVEMKRTGEDSLCCGGGAGRTWTEDSTPEKRPSVDRIREALAVGAEVVATACPFCVTTLEDAIKVLDVEDRIVVRDILEIVKEVI
jgi:Fe-S oxidoreductase